MEEIVVSEGISAGQMQTKKKDALGIVLRCAVIVLLILLFIPGLNPARMSGLVNSNASLFTTGISYGGFTEDFARALKKGWIEESVLIFTYIGAAAACIGIAGGIFMAIQYSGYENSAKIEKMDPSFPIGSFVFIAAALVCTVLSAVYFIRLPKANDEPFKMQAKYRLFLMMVPFIILIFLFSYLPLWGWRYAFFDYTPGSQLTMDKFVGFKWFTYLFQNSATRADIIRVLKNTLAMSGLGILTSWLPMAFAIFLSEIKCNRFRRIVQTITTIPNFISWVLVYTFAFALFSTEGFVNSFLINAGITNQSIDFLMGSDHIWLKMLGWGLWKGLGWSAIIYIAAISRIDQQLYEAATIDGAGRFRKMWHVTLPGLMPTFFVLLLLSIAGILSNGMEQYLVFKNATNKATIEVLDLYVYNLGLGGS